MQPISKQQIKRLHVELNKLRLRGLELTEYKRAMILQYTSNRTSSATGLYADEADAIIRDLSRATPQTAEQQADLKRKLIIHLARQMGWEQDGKADMKRINAWACNYGHGHKGFNEYTLQELSKLIWQMEQVYNQYLTSVI